METMENNKVISFRWNTGHIDIMLSSVLDLSPAELKKFIAVATVNADEIRGEIKIFLHDQMQEYKNNNKKLYDKCKKLMDVVECRKLTKAEKIVEKIFKSNDSDFVHRPNFCGIFQNAEKYCVTDGYRMLRYSEPFNCGFPSASGIIDTEKLMNADDYTIRLELPDLKILKQEIKIAKLGGLDFGNMHVVKSGRRIDVCYDFGYNLPMVNAQYLVDMMEVLPDCSAFCKVNGLTAPVYFVSGGNDGILLPVYDDFKQNQKPAESAAAVEIASDETPAVVTSSAAPSAVPSVESIGAESIDAETAATCIQDPVETPDTIAGDVPELSAADHVEIIIVDISLIKKARFLSEAAIKRSVTFCSAGMKRYGSARNIAGNARFDGIWKDCIEPAFCGRAETSSVRTGGRAETFAGGRSAASGSAAPVHPKNYKPPGMYLDGKNLILV